jgi:hypothetical protein
MIKTENNKKKVTCGNKKKNKRFYILIPFLEMAGAEWLDALGSCMDYLTSHISLSQIRRGFAPGFVNYKKGCTRLAAASDKVYQLLTHGWCTGPCHYPRKYTINV